MRELIVARERRVRKDVPKLVSTFCLIVSTIALFPYKKSLGISIQLRAVRGLESINRII
jgi:hypothetical protein